MPFEKPARTRLLGRSRLYVRADVPDRLFQWHAPRANRWECLHVRSGQLRVECLGVDGLQVEALTVGDERWVAPGTRWRIVQMPDDASFALDIYADASIEPAAPQPRRAAILDEATQLRIDDEAQFHTMLAKLAAGERRLVWADAAIAEWFAKAWDASGGCVCWHPLDEDDGRVLALVARAARPIDLLEYLGRDHAVLEAALTGALRGDALRMRCLRNGLARHLVIEEELLFPAYLDAGGTVGWVNGLCKEHTMLKRQLQALHDADHVRRFVMLLEAHDEKEEQIVYPDIAARLGPILSASLREVAILGVVPADRLQA
ncbi:MAG: hemerythrin domain-containing protein [Xanthomonadales bacterium]|nr:hemerythrin domain-containing protein [Xanthomonadales bacterium]